MWRLHMNLQDSKNFVLYWLKMTKLQQKSLRQTKKSMEKTSTFFPCHLSKLKPQKEDPFQVWIMFTV